MTFEDPDHQPAGKPVYIVMYAQETKSKDFNTRKEADNFKKRLGKDSFIVKDDNIDGKALKPN